jgi:hypothetical protein
MTIDDEAVAMAENVIAFEPRPKPVPAVQSVELYLCDDFSFEMRLYDDAGGVVARLEYGLVTKSPDGFDLDLLREAWDRWRGSSTIAS